MQQNLQSAKLGNTPIGKLIIQMSGPAILSMLVQALYNIVDSIFIGRYDAVNGVLAFTYAMPIQLLINAFCIGIAVGTGSLIARKLGEGKRDDASLVSQTGMLLALIVSAIFAIIGPFVAKAFIGAYTDDPIVYEMGSQYLTICICCSFGANIEVLLNRILQSMGNMVIPMITQIVGAVTNIILDPILISVCGLGAKGAAIATIIGQIVAMLIPIGVIVKKRGKMDIEVFFTRKFRLRKDILKDILQVGLPTIVMNSIGSVMFMVSNVILNGFTTPIVINETTSDFAVGVWAFGIYFKLQSFAFMPCFGLNQGCIPILGYNYGANNRTRFKKTYKTALIIAFCYMCFATIIFHAMPELLLKLFSAPDDATVIEIGAESLRLCALAFLPAAVSVISIAMFNSVGHGVKAMLISLLRQIGLLLPIGFLLSKFSSLGLTGFWVAFPIAEAVSIAIFAPIILGTIRKIFDKKDKLQLDESDMLQDDVSAHSHSALEKVASAIDDVEQTSDEAEQTA